MFPALLQLKKSIRSVCSPHISLSEAAKMIVHFCKFKPARRRKRLWLRYFQRGKNGIAPAAPLRALGKRQPRGGMKNNSSCSKTMIAREKSRDELVPNTARLENQEKF